MANSSVPKHDFAPAWLKIPGEVQRSSGTNGEHRERLSRRDDRTNGKGPCMGRQRQSSCDQQYPRREGRDLGRPHFSYRHHSIDVDESQYYNCGLGDYHIAGYRHFGSQPSLNPRTLSRQENPFSYTAAYKGYSLYDFTGDNYRNSNHSWNQGRHRSFDRSNNHVPTNNKKEPKSPDVPKDTSADRFNQEFPSLKGDVSEISGTSVNVNGGVWDNARNAKVYMNSPNNRSQKVELTAKGDSSEKRSGSPGTPSCNASNGGSSLGSPKPSPPPSLAQITKPNSQNQLSNSIYRSLVPSKGALTRKSSKESFRISSPIVNKSSRQSSPTPPLEILNTRLVTHPKNLGNKSDFLKTLRSESDRAAADDDAIQEQAVDKLFKENELEEDDDDDNKSEITNNSHENGEEEEEAAVEEMDNSASSMELNGIHCERLSEKCVEKPVLSSSLEAEQRLLREMGWKEEGSGDEDVYAPLTEDEMKEFENLSKKISQQRNGLQRHAHLTWSPKRLIPFTSSNVVLPLDDDDLCSSSSSDSE